MTVKRTNLYTYSGIVSYPEGAPTLNDIAVSLCREGRYAGAGVRWWPVGLHTFTVCDLVPPKVKVHAMLHDSTESVTGDVPKPVKTREIEELEEVLLVRIYKSLGVKFPTAKERELVHLADKEALRGEVYTVGTSALQALYPRSPRAEKLVMKYLAMYPPMECISPDGLAVIEFMRRFRIYSDIAKGR